MKTITDSAFHALLEEVSAKTAGVEGYLTPREVACLAWVGAHRTTNGEVLEVGSFKGRSTIVLALASRLAGDSRVSAVDPLTSPSVTDPALGKGETSGRERFEANLNRAGVRDRVEFYQMFSTDLARQWPPERPLRLLWIDGDHTYAGAKADFDAFRPFLADGAIVAMHDVLNHHGGPARVVAEAMLLSAHFGPAWFCGSIGWSQFFQDPARARPFRNQKLAQYRRLSRLISYTAFGEDIEGLRLLAYKLARARIPHRAPDPGAWALDVHDRTGVGSNQ
jgi:predicted O-methyltransferase YrrM